MSTSQVAYAIVAALVKAEAVMGQDRRWSPTNPAQEAFLREVFSQVRGEVSQGIRSLESKYSIAGNEITIKGVLDLQVKWIAEGGTTTIERDGQEWEGVRLIRVSFLVSDIHPHPIAVLPTQSDDILYITVLDEVPEPLRLRSLATSLLEEKNRPTYEYGGVCFPMVDLAQDNEVGWIVGMETTFKLDGQDVPARLVKASQETKLRMNEIGAHVRSEFIGRIMIGRAIPRPDYIVDRPFLLVVTRPELKQPLAVLYVTEGDWKNPGTLDFD